MTIVTKHPKNICANSNNSGTYAHSLTSVVALGIHKYSFTTHDSENVRVREKNATGKQKAPTTQRSTEHI